MTKHEPREGAIPTADFNPSGPADAGRSVASDASDGPKAELSPVGMLCDDILSTVGRSNGLSDEATMTIGSRITNILMLFRDQEHGARAAKEKISALKRDLRKVRGQLAVLRQEHFGASSEKGHVLDEDDNQDFMVDDEDDEPKEKPKGKRRRKVSEETEVVMVDHYPENMTCGCCGDQLKSIKREERVGSLRIIPEHVILVKDVYHTCACNKDICKDNKPVAAKSQNYIMKGRGLELGFVTEAASQKFFEHIPPFRMERRLRNANVNLSRQAIGANIAHLARHLKPVQQAILDHVKSGHVAHMDETPLRVLAPGNGKCANGFLWAICRDERKWNSNAQPAAVYHYAPSRAGSVAKEMLSGASLKVLQTDGYAGYNGLFKNEGRNDGLIVGRCWAHARRKFVDVSRQRKSKLAHKVVKMTQQMYKVERAASGLSPEERQAMRLEHSLPIVDEMHALLLKYQNDAEGTLKSAMNYTLNAFDGLRQYIYDGRVEIDNNPIERCIRGIALSKKNSLFAGSDEAAEVWAIYYSLIESARLNHINPRSYLNWVVGKIEAAQGDIDYSTLMPWYCPVGHVHD